MVTLAITAILFSGGLARFMSFQRNQKVDSAVRQVRVHLNNARQNALIGKKKADDGTCACDKGLDGVCGTTDDPLMDGWVFAQQTTSPLTSYEVYLTCQGSTTHYLVSSYNLPSDVAFAGTFDPILFNYNGNAPFLPFGGVTMNFTLSGVSSGKSLVVKQGGDIGGDIE